MIPFQERKKIRRILYSKVTIFVLFLVLVVVVRGAWSIHKKAQIALSERDIAARALIDIESRTVELEKSMARFNSEQGIEEEIRQKYTVAKEGEEVVVVVDDNHKKGKNGEVGEKKGFFQQIKDFFLEEIQ